MNASLENNPFHSTLARIERIIGPINRQTEVFRQKWTGEEAILQKSLSIQEQINNYTSTEHAEKHLTSTLDQYFGLFAHSDQYNKKKVKKIIEQAEDTFISFLFYKGRPQVAFDPEKELTQIRAVFHHFKEDDHAAMYTGAGKTSADIPIFILTKALFNPVGTAAGYPNVIGSSADIPLTKDLENKVRKYQEIVIQALADRNASEMTKRNTQYHLSILPDEMKIGQENMQTENEPTLRSFFQSSPTYLSWLKTCGVNIGFQVHDQLVFDSTQTYRDLQDALLREKGSQDIQVVHHQIARYMKAAMPVSVMDEIYLANQAPYITESSTNSKGKIQINLDYPAQKQVLSDYVLLRLIEENITEQGDFLFKGQQTILTESGMQKLFAFRRELLNNIDGYLKDGSKFPMIERIQAIIRYEIRRACSFEDNLNTKQVENKVMEFMRDFWNLDDGTVEQMSFKREEDGHGASAPWVFEEGNSETEGDVWLLLKAEGFFNTIKSVKKGVHYLTPTLLKDNLRGVLLPERKFTADVPFQLGVTNKQFINPEEKTIDQQIDFNTWIGLVAQGNVIGLSNDLYYTDPWTGKRDLTPLGQVLEKHTNGKVIDLAPKIEVGKTLPIPEPTIMENMSQVIGGVVKDVIDRLKGGNKRPEMIICWNEKEAKKMYSQFKIRHQKVAFIDSQTADESADTIHEEFANNQWDILITTGRKSYGADFKDRQGIFTDFRVNVINPETVFQIAQAFGRRRGDKHMEDFSIYFNEDFILDLGTILQEKSKTFQNYFLSNLLKHKDESYDKLEELTLKLLGKGNKPITEVEKGQFSKLIIEALRKNQKKISSDWEKEIEFETIFIQNIAPKIREVKRSLIEHQWRMAASPLSLFIEKEIKTRIELAGFGDIPIFMRKELEENLANAIYGQYWSLNEGIYSDYHDYVNKFLPLDPSVQNNDQAKELLAINWMDRKLEEEYLPAWENDLLDPQSEEIQKRIGRNIKENVDFQVQKMLFIKSELEKRGMKLGDVEEAPVLFSPLYYLNSKSEKYFETVPENATVTVSCHNQKIFDLEEIDEVDYIKDKTVVLTRKRTNKYVYDAEAGIYRPAMKEEFERGLEILNNIRTDYFKGRKIVDLYYPGENTRKFVRVVLK